MYSLAKNNKKLKNKIIYRCISHSVDVYKMVTYTIGFLVISVIGVLLHLFVFSSFIIHHMPDESHKDETCKSHITLVQLSLLNFILYHLCNFLVFVSTFKTYFDL